MLARGSRDSSSCPRAGPHNPAGSRPKGTLGEPASGSRGQRGPGPSQLHALPQLLVSSHATSFYAL